MRLWSHMTIVRRRWRLITVTALWLASSWWSVYYEVSPSFSSSSPRPDMSASSKSWNPSSSTCERGRVKTLLTMMIQTRRRWWECKEAPCLRLEEVSKRRLPINETMCCISASRYSSHMSWCCSSAPFGASPRRLILEWFSIYWSSCVLHCWLCLRFRASSKHRTFWCKRIFQNQPCLRIKSERSILWKAWTMLRSRAGLLMELSEWQMWRWERKGRRSWITCSRWCTAAWSLTFNRWVIWQWRSIKISN